jgi:hypothetical protein
MVLKRREMGRKKGAGGPAPVTFTFYRGDTEKRETGERERVGRGRV